jgi:outer membrane protein assembly factor BamC
VTTLNGQPAVQIDEGFDRAWRRVGVALDRTGFTVEDRDRSRACTSCATWPTPNGRKKKGFFGKMFSQGRSQARQVPDRRAQRRRQVQRGGAGRNGQPESDVNAQRIVRVIADDLK